MCMMNIETEKVIALVRDRPVLWDSSTEHYKSREVRSASWEEVYVELFPEYKSDDCMRKREIERAVQQRWKTARDAYIRSKNLAKVDSVPRRPYAYTNQLRFLDKIRSNFDEDSNDTYGNISEERNAWLNIDRIPSQFHISDVQRSFDQDDTTAQNASYHYENNSAVQVDYNEPDSACTLSNQNNLLKRKREDVPIYREMLNIIKDNASAMDMMKNDDLAFFVSMLPIIECFSNRQKMLFRSEVMKKAMEISEMQAKENLPKPSTSCLNSETDPLNVEVKTEPLP